MEGGSVKGQGEAAPTTVAVGAASFAGRWCSRWRACRCRRVVSLIFAGWIPQDGLFGCSGPLV